MLGAIIDGDPKEMMLRIPVVLLALTVHEFCHAYFALLMGDPTAYRLGRCTLNPLKHLDPLGTICLMFAPIGWAKPVPINPSNFRNWRQGVLVSTAAGPLSNLVQALLFALLMRGAIALIPRIPNISCFPDPVAATRFMLLANEMFLIAIAINVGLAVFNCLPIYPLDGFHITLQLMRPEAQERFVRMAPAGPFMILGLVLISNHTNFDILGTLVRRPFMLILTHVAGLG